MIWRPLTGSAGEYLRRPSYELLTSAARNAELLPTLIKRHSVERVFENSQGSWEISNHDFFGDTGCD